MWLRHNVSTTKYSKLDLEYRAGAIRLEIEQHLKDINKNTTRGREEKYVPSKLCFVPPNVVPIPADTVPPPSQMTLMEDVLSTITSPLKTDRSSPPLLGGEESIEPEKVVTPPPTATTSPQQQHRGHTKKSKTVRVSNLPNGLTSQGLVDAFTTSVGPIAEGGCEMEGDCEILCGCGNL